MTPTTVVLMLVLLLSIQPVTTDLYLPALPSLQQDLGTTVSAAQLTLSALILSFGLAQLVCGPLSDRFGRRPVLLWGLGLFSGASVLAAAAPSIEALVVARVLQGAAMASAVTGARSIVRDLFEPLEGARVMSRSLTGLGLIALVSPLLGGAVAQWANWHVALSLVVLFGVGTWVYVARHFTETVPLRNLHATRLGPLWRNWCHIAAHPTFRAYAMLLASSYGGLFILLAASSFVFIDTLGLSRLAYGGMLACNSASYIVGTFVCRRVLVRYGLRRTVAVGGALSLGGGTALAVASLAGWHETSVWALIVPQWLFFVGHGMHQPCAQTGVVAPFRDKAGTAASLSGFFMMLTAFVVGQWLGWSLNGTVFPLTLGVAAFSVAVAATAWTLVQRHGEPPLPIVLAQPA